MIAPPTIQEQLMLNAAAQYYGAEPPCGAPKLVRVKSAPASTWTQSDSQAWVGPGGPSNCRVQLLSSAWTHRTETREFGIYCRLMAHEYGHLFGIWDSPLPGTMQSHIITSQVPDVPCDQAQLIAGS